MTKLVEASAVTVRHGTVAAVTQEADGNEATDLEAAYRNVGLRQVA